MTKISMKSLLGASSAVVIAAISLTPAAHAQMQPGYTAAQPGYAEPAPMAPAPQQNSYIAPQPNADVPQQNAYVPPPAATEPSQLRPMESRYPGPKLN
jgi:hypothetical protein